MVTPTIVGDALVLEIIGLDKLWSLRSRLEIPLSHVRSVKPDPGAARGWFDGLKLAGSHIPGLLTAGTFYEDGELVFWDVHKAENAIAIDLDHDRYRRLIIEVADPKGTVAMIERALSGRKS
jgi:hypothetical protein